MASAGSQPEKTARSKQIIWRRLRQATQVLALLLFLYLFLGTQQELQTLLPHDLFFRLDPLAGISAMLASRSWILPLALGGATIAMAVAAGRAWCGWICPMGTLLEWTPARRPSHNRLDIPSYWRQAKYFVFLTVLLAAIAGSLTLLVLDPITLLFRTLAGVVLPGLNSIIGSAETLLYRIEGLRPAVEWFDTLARGSFMTEQLPFLPNLLIAAIFGSVLTLNAIRPRFWCRYLCPLGAMLGLVSKAARVRHKVDNEKCIACRRCAAVCPTGAIDPENKFAASAAECTACFDCVQACPTQAISFGRQRGLVPHHRHDPSRRQFLASAGAAAIGAVLLRLLPSPGHGQTPLIRPPAATEELLSSQCIRCSECVKVCPTGVIQPSYLPSSWDKLWAPMLVTRLGYCDYSCTACGEACPTGAIPRLSLAEKRQTVIGKASIDRKRCIPWAEDRDCIVCEEMCPVPNKAVRLEERRVANAAGQTTVVRVPVVRPNLCIGCGICETQCPVNGEAAIRVYPFGNGKD